MASKAALIDLLASTRVSPTTGLVWEGALVGFFVPGTATGKAVWLDRDKTLPTGAGQETGVLAADGSFTAYGDGIYDIKIYNSEDTGYTTPIKTYSSVNIQDATLAADLTDPNFLDGTDPTKIVSFDISNISSGTTRDQAFPDKDGTFAMVSGETFTDPVLNGSVTGSGVLDEDDFASDSATKIATQQSIKAYADSLSPVAPVNLINNPNMSVAQRGTSFDSTTTPANNDDTYLIDQWLLLSDGNDIVDVTQQTAGGVNGNSDYIRLDVETTAKKFGIFQPIEYKTCKDIIGGTASVSFDCRVSNATKLSDIRAVVVAWDSTQDTITSDIINAWGAEGANPTLVANWTEENTAANLSVTTSWVRYSINSIAIDTASTTNVGLFIYQNNVATNDTAGVFLEITNVKLSSGVSTGDFFSKDYSEDILACSRLYYRAGGIAESVKYQFDVTVGNSFLWQQYHPVEMRVAPTVTKVGTWTINAAVNNVQPSVADGTIEGYTLNSGVATGSGTGLIKCADATTYVDVTAEL